jgi:Raf kinase inhibitor-like YbhB/YbcL family protein
MKKMHFGLLATALAAFTVATAHAQGMSVTSVQISNGGTIKNEQVFKGFGCTGGDISPSLKWSGAPNGVKSFAITMYDPDAPTGSGWWHWVAFNIPASTTSIPKNAGNPKAATMPHGTIQSRTDFGIDGYGGPCPPKGAPPHHYTITVFAVDVAKLPDAENADASPAIVGFDLHFHTLGKATLTATYGR